jgi:hypothetical protein
MVVRDPDGYRIELIDRSEKYPPVVVVPPPVAHRSRLGRRARHRRAFCLEPLARIPADRAIRFREVWIAEVAIGVAMAIYVASGRSPSR